MTAITVTASDGLPLAVHTYTGIDAGRTTILAVHGYPDNHHVWDGIAARLGDRYKAKYNFVAYDVRGAGDSKRPFRQTGYRLSQLVSDLDAVIDSLSVDRVHLLAHDWGSIQGWAAVTDASVLGRIASFTSISGPHLNYAGRFIRSARTPRAIADVAKQVLASSYIWFFLCPGVPEVAIRSGITAKVFEAVERIGRPRGADRRSATYRSIDDYLNGLNLYRANMPGPILSPPAQLPQTTVPAQVLVARQDHFVSPALQRFAGSIPARGRVVPIEGGHWVVISHPDVVARLTAEWIDRVGGSAIRNSTSIGQAL